MASSVDLSPVAVHIAWQRRLPQLLGGLTLFAISMAMMVRAQIGLAPWDVFHQGLAGLTGLSFGAVTAVTGVLVLLAWVPIRQRPGIGTVANVIVIAIVVDLALRLLPSPTGLGWRLLLLIGGIICNGIATAAYVVARLGPGPRDGLMTGVCARWGGSVRVVRTCIEVSVLSVGWLLGGTVGVGTVLYALSIGPLAQLFLTKMAYRQRQLS